LPGFVNYFLNLFFHGVRVQQTAYKGLGMALRNTPVTLDLQALKTIAIPYKHCSFNIVE